MKLRKGRGRCGAMGRRGGRQRCGGVGSTGKGEGVKGEKTEVEELAEG